MKKALALILTLSLTAALLAGCGGGDANPGGEAGETASSTDGTYAISIAHSTAEDTTDQAFALAFKEYVETNSGGAITVNVYPNAQLGSDREVVEAVQNNEITMTATANAVQANFVPDAFILDIPFTFATMDAVRYTMEDEGFLEAMGASYDAANLRLMGYTCTGFRVLSCNKPVHTPDDVKGMTIRTMENEYHMAAWKAIGANPTPLAFSELYTALQQGTVDAQENPIELIVTQKFYEQQDYVVETNHLGQFIPWVMSKTFYDSLPAELQTVVDEGIQVGRQAAFDHLESTNDANRQAVIDSGTEIITLTEEELAAFAERTAPVNDMIKEAVSQTIYDAYMASCEAYKAAQ